MEPVINFDISIVKDDHFCKTSQKYIEYKNQILLLFLDEKIDVKIEIYIQNSILLKNDFIKLRILLAHVVEALVPTPFVAKVALDYIY